MQFYSELRNGKTKNDTKWMLRHILYYYIEALNDNEVKFLFYKSHPIRLN